MPYEGSESARDDFGKFIFQFQPGTKTLIRKLERVLNKDYRLNSFFQAAVVSILLYGCTTWTLTKRPEKKAWQQLHKNAASNIEHVLEAIPHKAAAKRPPTTHHENYSG